MDKDKHLPTLSRREFLKIAAATTATTALGLGKENQTSSASAILPLFKEIKTEQLPSRKEHFMPFTEGFAQWQYVEFQYQNDNNQRIGITVSLGEALSEFGIKKHQLLVMHHNLDTQESLIKPYDGESTFDELNSKYTFTDKSSNILAELSYSESGDNYLLKIHTPEFNTITIDPNGLVLRPQGPLIPVSKVGNFTVASFENGKITTNYFADHVRVERNGEILGYGRRDSENLVAEGVFPPDAEVDHTWIHVSGSLNDGTHTQFFATAWGSKTGGNYRFADLLLIDPTTEKQYFVELNEDNTNFNLQFIPNLEEQDEILGSNGKPIYNMPHGGQVIAKFADDTLFDFTIDGNPRQIIEGKGNLSMIEAHGKPTGGSVLNIPIVKCHSALWETSLEMYRLHAPHVANQ